MKIRVIGAQGGVTPNSKATSFLIDEKLLLDAGSVAQGLGIKEQALIDTILISHPHLDHIQDLAYICDNCFGQKGKPFEVYGGAVTIDAIKKHLMNDIIWPDFSKLPSESNPTIHFNILAPLEKKNFDGYEVLPVPVNHPLHATGYIIKKDDCSLLFTQDTGPTEMIWEKAHRIKNLKAVFTEVSFPNSLRQVARDSLHHTPDSFKEELVKIPSNVPIFVSHLKPHFQDQLIKEINAIGDSRITILHTDDVTFNF